MTTTLDRIEKAEERVRAFEGKLGYMLSHKLHMKILYEEAAKTEAEEKEAITA